jgi:hypothetical protein
MNATPTKFLGCAGVAIVLIAILASTTIATAQNAKQKSNQPRGQYSVPSDQEHWYDRSCNTFNT